MKQVYRTKIGQPEKITLPKLCACIFCGCFFFGVLMANLRFSDEALWIGFINENHIRQFSAVRQEISYFLKFALRSRLIPWIVTTVGGAFFWGSAVCGLWFGWLGVSGGFLLAALIQRHGLKGILIMCGMGFPQYLIYAASYIILLKLIRIYRKEKKKGSTDILNSQSSKKSFGIYVLFSILITAIFILGILAEYYVNPFILKMMQ